MEKNKNKNDWKNIIQGFAGDMLERASDNVSKKVHVFVAQLKRRTIGLALVLIGFIFSLVSAAILINAISGNEYPWVGWGLTGLIIIVIGYVMSKD